MNPYLKPGAKTLSSELWRAEPSGEEQLRSRNHKVGVVEHDFTATNIATY